VRVATQGALTTFLSRLLDRRDDCQARRRRDELGRSLKLVSWQRLPDRRWRARLSCDEWPETIVRAGRTRCEAIDQAERALQVLLVGLFDRPC